MKVPYVLILCLMAFGSVAVAVETQKVAVMVDSELYPDFTTDISNYVADVEANFPVELLVYTNNYRNLPFEMVRAELKNVWQNEDIVGVIQVGFFPTLLFNMQQGTSPQPIGYMDLDGTFTDENTNFDENLNYIDEVVGVPDGVYDRHYWNNNGLEIWCALIRPYQPSATSTDYTAAVRQQLHDFFDKTHAYYNNQLVIPRRGLNYINLDWAYDGPAVETIFNETYGPTNTVSYYGGRQSGFNFMEELAAGFETTYLYSHSTYNFHGFDRGSWCYVHNTQLIPENGRGSVMTSGFNCHGANYSADPADGCMGQRYVFGSDLGQAFRGCSITYGTVGLVEQAEKLRDGQYLGQAYFEVVNAFYEGRNDLSPEYADPRVFGQVLLGNPFVTGSASQNFSAPPASISGNVIGSNEVRLTAKKDGKIMGVYYSDSGSFMVDYLPGGTYDMMIETLEGAYCGNQSVTVANGQALTGWDITLPSFGSQTNSWYYFHIPENSGKTLPSDWNSPGANVSLWDGQGPCPIGFDSEALLRGGTGISPWYSDLYVRKNFTVSGVAQNQRVYVYASTASLTVEDSAPEVWVNGNLVTMEKIEGRTVMSYWQYRADVTSLVTGGSDYITAKTYEHIDISAPVYITGTFIDNDPPSPNPASFTTTPYATGTDTIEMVAATGLDVSGPIEYSFTCTAGGGNNSGWQTSASYTDTGLIANTTYAYTVTLRDSLGNTGTASSALSATTDAAGITSVEDTDATYSGGWGTDNNASLYSGGTCHYGNTVGGYFEITFTGNEIRWYGLKNNDLGYADVYVDGNLEADNVDCYGTVRAVHLLFEKTDLVLGSHTIRVVVDGGKNAASASTYLVHDYFEYETSQGPDETDPPTPNPASFAVAPYAIGTDSIAMVATIGTDASGPVEYYFTCTAGGGNDSGWQTTANYVDTGLSQNTTYTYAVMMRDMLGNTTATSSATTQTPADNDPPTPNPATFTIDPIAVGPDTIMMVAEIGVDVSGPVEYYFTCTSGGGHDSGWQTLARYSDTGLNPGTSYTYTVKMRDKWGNAGTPSSLASAPTEVSDQAPYGGTARSIPGQIEAEHYDEGGEMDAYHDTTTGNAGNTFRFDDVDLQSCSDTGGGYQIGYIKDGEWLEYTVDVATGNYDISGRFSTYSTDRKLRFLLDGVEICQLDVPQTGDWNNWQTGATTNVYIRGGNDKVLRLEVMGGDFNFNWIKFEDVTPPLSAWLYQHQLEGDAAAPAADPDGDGMNNLGEYAFGGDPTNEASRGRQPWFEGDLKFIYQLIDDTNITAQIITKTDLVTGGTTVDVSFVGSGPGVSGFINYTNIIDTSAQDTGFLSLELSCD